MATPSQTFNPARFAAALRKEWGENRRQLLLLTFLPMGMMAVALFWLTMAKFSEISAYCQSLLANSSDFASGVTSLSVYKEYHGATHIILAWILVAFACLTASLAFSSTATKEGVLNDLATPASRFEKFAARFVIYILGAWVAAIAGWIIDVFATYLIMDIFTPIGHFFLPTTTGPLFDSATPRSGTITSVTLFFTIFLQSIFFLGSTVWPKSSFVKTFVSAFAIAATMVIIAVTTVKAFADTLHPSGNNIPAFLDHTLTYLILLAIMAMINYTIAFIRYRETDVVRRW